MPNEIAPPDAPGPLAGIRVLDLGLLVQGPQAALLLGDMGADVIKVELPGFGDQARWIPISPSDLRAPYFIACNRGKRSITIDLRAERGREVFLRLADTADVVVSNFVPGTLERWGIDYDERLFAKSADRLRLRQHLRPGGHRRDPQGCRHRGPGERRADPPHRARCGLDHADRRDDRRPHRLARTSPTGSSPRCSPGSGPGAASRSRCRCSAARSTRRPPSTRTRS